MIGDHTDCPTRIFALLHVEGDGRIVNRITKGHIYATREAAEVGCERYRSGRPDIQEYVLDADGLYVEAAR